MDTRKVEPLLEYANIICGSHDHFLLDQKKPEKSTDV